MRNALVLPSSGRGRGPEGWLVDGGVYGPRGREIRIARPAFEKAACSQPPALRRDDLRPRRGRWLFGGWLQPIFGHYLVFSMGHLWPLAAPGANYTGVVFQGLTGPDLLERDHALRALLACLGIGTRIPAIVAKEPMRFAHLTIGEPMRLGRPAAPARDAAFMALMRALAASAPADDGLVLRGVYVSRSRLSNKGGFVLESVLEENLAAEGYAILHPERLSIPDQFAVYRAARRVIFAEGTALHLAIGALDPDIPVGVIARRRPMIPAMRYYLEGAGMRRAACVDAIRSVVTYGDGDRSVGGALANGLAVLDFEALRDGLVAAGLCRGTGWRIPTPAEVEAEIARAVEERQKVWRKQRVAEIAINDFFPPPTAAPG
ncbi:glycosyltransferase 61 family protein [Falsiroseomonas sp. HW251]|uniref:glycosyltransferase 61 family protein n=1 Tax=Falsiroseomonas sp. HW251 TaxID=3390998 RepID=UPI003D322539